MVLQTNEDGSSSPSETERLTRRIAANRKEVLVKNEPYEPASSTSPVFVLDELFNRPFSRAQVPAYRIFLYLLRVGGKASMPDIKRGPAGIRKPDNNHTRYIKALADLYDLGVVTTEKKTKRGEWIVTLNKDVLEKYTTLLPLPVLDSLEKHITRWARMPAKSKKTFYKIMSELKDPQVLEACGKNFNIKLFTTILKDSPYSSEEVSNSFLAVKRVTIPAKHPQRMHLASDEKKEKYLCSFFEDGRTPEKPRLDPEIELIMYYLRDQEGFLETCLSTIRERDRALERKLLSLETERDFKMLLRDPYLRALIREVYGLSKRGSR